MRKSAGKPKRSVRPQPGPPQSAEAHAPAARLLGQLDEKIRQLSVVNGVLRTAAANPSIAEILRVLGWHLKEICPFDRMSVSLYDAERRAFHVPFACVGGRVTETREEPRAWGETPLSRVIETRQPLLRRNIREEMSFAKDQEFVRLGIGCEALFPLLAGDRPIGTFQISSFEPGRLTERHVALVGELLPAIALAVQQCLLREKPSLV